jgi:hypothetical protein
MILHSCCTTILHLTRLTSNGDLHFSHGWSLYFAPHQLQHDHDPPSLVLVIIHHFPSPSSFSMLVLASLYLFLLSCPCCYHDHGCRHYHSWCNTSTQCFDAQHPWQSQSSHTPPADLGPGTWDLLASSPPQYHPQYQSHCLHLLVLIPNGFLLQEVLQIHSAASPTN